MMAQADGSNKRIEGTRHITLTYNILRQIWKARNSWQFNQVRVQLPQVIQRVVGEWTEFESIQDKQEDKK